MLELKIPTDAKPGQEQRVTEGKEGQCRLGMTLIEEWPCPRIECIRRERFSHKRDDAIPPVSIARYQVGRLYFIEIV